MIGVELYNGDCLEVMKSIPSLSVHAVFADLPYGTTNNKWDSVIPFPKLWSEYNRIVKQSGVVILTCHGIFTAKVILSNETNFKYKYVWEKSKATNFLNAKSQPLRKHEDICIFYKRQPTYNPQMIPGKAYDKGVRKDQCTGSYNLFSPSHVKSDGMRYPTDMLYFKTAESEGAVLHPTQKPVALSSWFIRTYTNPGDTVMDNAMGSGSTGISCIDTGRLFIGIEKDPDIFKIAENRILNYNPPRA